MFDLLPQFWVPVGLAKHLKKRPLKITVAGEQLVLFRDDSGRAQALLDLCPHRSVKLSLGTVAKNGCIECPFHGWQFKGDGTCVKVPLNPSAKKESLHATAIPIHEEACILWIYTGTNTPSPLLPNIPKEIVEARHIEWLASPWACHWTRAMENLLDVPHLSFIHGKSIGRGVPSPNKIKDLELTYNIVEDDLGFKLTAKYSSRKDHKQILDWRKPCLMVLNLSETRHLFNYCVPVTERQTNMLVISAHKGSPILLPFYKLMNFLNRFILSEDQKVVESSHPAEIPYQLEDIHLERSVATDRATLIFRSWYREVKRQQELTQIDMRQDSIVLVDG